MYRQSLFIYPSGVPFPLVITLSPTHIITTVQTNPLYLLSHICFLVAHILFLTVHIVFLLVLMLSYFYASFSHTFLDTYSHRLLFWIHKFIDIVLLLIFLMFLLLSVFHFIFLVSLYFSYFMTFQGLMTVIIKTALFRNIALLYLTRKVPNLLPPFSKRKKQVSLRTFVPIYYPTQH